MLHVRTSDQLSPAARFYTVHLGKVYLVFCKVFHFLETTVVAIESFIGHCSSISDSHHRLCCAMRSRDRCLLSVKGPLSSTPSGSGGNIILPEILAACAAVQPLAPEALVHLPGNETAPCFSRQQDGVHAVPPAARKPGCLGLFAGWFCVCVILISCPIDAPWAVQPGGHASFLG